MYILRQEACSEFKKDLAADELARGSVKINRTLVSVEGGLPGRRVDLGVSSSLVQLSSSSKPPSSCKERAARGPCDCFSTNATDTRDLQKLGLCTDCLKFALEYHE